MPTIRVLTNSPTQRLYATDPPAHRKVTLSSLGASLTFPLVDPEVDLSSLAMTWERQDRYRRKPALAPVGEDLAKIKLQVLAFAEGERGGSCLHILRTLVGLARSRTGLALAYSALETDPWINPGGRWTMTGLDVNVTHRRQGDNVPTEAEVDLELTEHVALPRPPGAGEAAIAPVVMGAFAEDLPLAELREVTVRGGETMLGAARRLTGTTTVWRAVADRNALRDVRDLPAGLRIRL